MLSSAGNRTLCSISNRLSVRTATQWQRSSIRQAHNKTAFTLNTGAKIPALGFGTWQDKDAQEAAVTTALEAGYRHIDTAHVYGTEPAVGHAIHTSSISRSEIFLTTKLWNNAHHPDDVAPALDASLAALNTPYVDLYLMHWPSPFARSPSLFPKDASGNTAPGDADYVATWQAMEALLASGKTRAIGVSNFGRAELDRLLSKARVVPAVHQLELHPWLQQSAFAAWNAERGIHVTQYSPFGNQNDVYDRGRGRGKLIDEPLLGEIGARYGKSAAQVALAWGIAHGRSVIPKSKTEERIKQNLEGDISLEEEDVRRIDAMDKKLRFNDPSESFGWNFFADLDGKQQ